MNGLVWIGIGLLVLWVLGWLFFEVAGAAIHLLLVIGALMLVGWAVRRFMNRHATPV